SEPAPDLPRLEEWSREEVVRERFEGLANSIEMERRTLPWSADSPEAFVASMERHAPMQASAKANMPADDYQRLREELVELAGRWAGGDGPIAMDAPYVLIVARKRG
ncbi:MAG: hypothetical protein ACRDSN_01145, partial [Pseudonocardiaceae bacterium]